jgi:hypothetical protein
MQTRKEIDAEKAQRSHLLNFVVVLLGALAVSLTNSRAQDLVAGPQPLPSVSQSLQQLLPSSTSAITS